MLSIRCLLCGVSYINESSLKKHFISIHEVIIDEIIQIQETEQSQNVHFQDVRYTFQFKYKIYCYYYYYIYFIIFVLINILKYIYVIL